MQVNVNQDTAVRQYTQNVQSARTVTAPVTDTKEEASASAVQKDVDRAEFSKDTAVTGKMSDSERSALVQSLKDDLNNQMSRFTNMMTQMFQKQGITGAAAQGDNMWKLIASGNFTVDAQTKAEAQEAISEDGYWGVKQTSQRIFDFAYALAGDDPEKMKKMQAAVEKGFEQATQAWGKSLPSIAQETHSAIGDLFDSYYEKAGKTE